MFDDDPELASLPSFDTVAAPKRKAPPAVSRLTDLADQNGFTVTSTTGGKHNVGSAHYRGDAVDVRTKDKTPDEVNAMIQKAAQAGYRALDEQQQPPGQKVWGGPHLHIEDTPESRTLSSLPSFDTVAQKPKVTSPPIPNNDLLNRAAGPIATRTLLTDATNPAGTTQPERFSKTLYSERSGPQINGIGAPAAPPVAPVQKQQARPRFQRPQTVAPQPEWNPNYAPGPTREELQQVRSDIAGEEAAKIAQRAALEGLPLTTKMGVEFGVPFAKSAANLTVPTVANALEAAGRYNPVSNMLETAGVDTSGHPLRQAAQGIRSDFEGRMQGLQQLEEALPTDPASRALQMGGTIAGTIPAYEVAGLVPGGQTALNFASQDWKDPKQAAKAGLINTALMATGGKASEMSQKLGQTIANKTGNEFLGSAANAIARTAGNAGAAMGLTAAGNLIEGKPITSKEMYDQGLMGAAFANLSSPKITKARQPVAYQNGTEIIPIDVAKAAAENAAQPAPTAPEAPKPATPTVQPSNFAPVPVKGSGNVSQIGYDPTTQTMRVKFSGGAEYDYAGVPPNVYAAMEATAHDPTISTGDFLNKNIKGKYEFTKIGAPEKSPAPEGSGFISLEDALKAKQAPPKAPAEAPKPAAPDEMDAIMARQQGQPAPAPTAPATPAPDLGTASNPNITAEMRAQREAQMRVRQEQAAAPKPTATSKVEILGPDDPLDVPDGYRLREFKIDGQEVVVRVPKGIDKETAQIIAKRQLRQKGQNATAEVPAQSSELPFERPAVPAPALEGQKPESAPVQTQATVETPKPAPPVEAKPAETPASEIKQPLSQEPKSYLPDLQEIYGVADHPSFPGIERRLNARQGIKDTGKFHALSFRGFPDAEGNKLYSLAEHPEVRKMMDLPEMPNYENNGPAYAQAAQHTMDALAEAAGLSRSSEAHGADTLKMQRYLQAQGASDSVMASFHATRLATNRYFQNVRTLFEHPEVDRLLDPIAKAMDEGRPVDRGDTKKLMAAVKSVAEEINKNAGPYEQIAPTSIAKLSADLNKGRFEGEPSGSLVRALGAIRRGRGQAAQGEEQAPRQGQTAQGTTGREARAESPVQAEPPKADTSRFAREPKPADTAVAANRPEPTESAAASVRPEPAGQRGITETVSHPNPEIDGREIVAKTATGKVVVANEANKSGVSIVTPQEKGSETVPDRTRLEAELADLRKTAEAQYWAFTRQAKAKPVDPAITRKIADLETQLGLRKEFWQRTQAQVKAAEQMPAEKHRQYVEKAVTEGKPVPPEVLADYPDLAAKGEPTFESKRKTGTLLETGHEGRAAREAEPVASVITRLKQNISRMGGKDAFEQKLLERVKTNGVKVANEPNSDTRESISDVSTTDRRNNGKVPTSESANTNEAQAKGRTTPSDETGVQPKEPVTADVFLSDETKQDIYTTKDHTRLLQREEDRGKPAFIINEIPGAILYTESGKWGIRRDAKGNTQINKIQDLSKEGFNRILRRDFSTDRGDMNATAKARLDEIGAAEKTRQTELEAQRAQEREESARAQQTLQRSREFYDNIDQAFAKEFKGKRQNIQIATPEGSPAIEVPATVYDGTFAIHKSGGGKNPYTVTHVGTGRSVGDWPLRDARALIYRLLKETNGWDFTDIKNAPQELMNKAAGIAKEVRKAEAPSVSDQKPAQAVDLPEPDWITEKPVKEAKPTSRFSRNTNPDIQDFGEKIGGARKDTAVPLGPKRKTAAEEDIRPSWEKKYSIGEIGTGSDKGKFSVHRDDGSTGVRRSFRGYNDPKFDTRAEAEAAIPLLEVNRKHRVGVDRVEGQPDSYYIYRKVADGKYPRVKEGFASRTEAEAYIAEHPKEIIEHKFPDIDKARPWLDKITREGAPRREGDVSTKQFQDDFGFRGGEFGNWNKGGDGQQALNHAYDGLHDLSETLGISPRALSLNGELAIAFGARGHGLQGARAHYEPDKAVINLTKIHGAGALSHEWFHALDHFVGRTEAGIESYAADKQGRFATEGFSHKTKAEQALVDAWKNIVNTITAKHLDVPIEYADAARNAAHQSENVNEHLTRLKQDFERDDSRYNKRWKAPTTEQKARWDALAEKIAAGDVGKSQFIKGKSAFKGRSSFDAIEELNDLYKEVKGRSFYTASDNSSGQDLYWRVLSMKKMQARVAQAEAGLSENKKIPTDYFKEAKKADESRVSDYYSTEKEMGARAFEAYIFDKLKEQGRQSDYLVHGVENKYYKGLDLKPYPEGAERQAINKAFDALFENPKLMFGVAAERAEPKITAGLKDINRTQEGHAQIISDLADWLAPKIVNTAHNIARVTVDAVKTFGTKVKPFVRQAYEQAKAFFNDQRGSVTADLTPLPEEIDWKRDTRGTLGATISGQDASIQPYGKGKYEAYLGETDLGVFSTEDAAKAALGKAGQELASTSGIVAQGHRAAELMNTGDVNNVEWKRIDTGAEGYVYKVALTTDSGQEYKFTMYPEQLEGTFGYRTVSAIIGNSMTGGNIRLGGVPKESPVLRFLKSELGSAKASPGGPPIEESVPKKEPSLERLAAARKHAREIQMFDNNPSEWFGKRFLAGQYRLSPEGRHIFSGLFNEITQNVGGDTVKGVRQRLDELRASGDLSEKDHKVAHALTGMYEMARNVLNGDYKDKPKQQMDDFIKMQQGFKKSGLDRTALGALMGYNNFSMLSGGATMGRPGISSVITGIAEMGARTAAAPIDIIWNRKGGKRQVTGTTPGEFGSAVASGAVDGIKDLWRTVRTGVSKIDATGHGQVVTYPEVDTNRPSNWSSVSGIKNKGANVLGVAENLTSRIHKGVHSPAYFMARAAAMEAGARLLVKDVAGKDKAAEMAHILENPPAELIYQADNAAMDATLYKKNALVQAWDGLLRKANESDSAIANAAGHAARFISPFARVGLNAAAKTADYHGLTLARHLAYDNWQGKNYEWGGTDKKTFNKMTEKQKASFYRSTMDPAEQVKFDALPKEAQAKEIAKIPFKLSEARRQETVMAGGRAAIGALGMAAGALLQSMGMLGQEESDDKNKGEVGTDQLEGKRPGGVAIKGRNYDIGYLGHPLATTLFTGARIYDALKDKGKGSGLDQAADIAKQAAWSATKATPAGEYIKDIRDASKYGVGDVAARTALSPTRWIPGPIRDTTLATDRIKRKQSTIADAWKANIPGLSKTVTPKLDAAGRTIPQPWPYDPTRSTPLQPENKVYEEMDRVGLGIANSRKRPGESDNAYQKREQDQLEMFNRRATALMNTARYQAMSEDDQKQALGDLLKASRGQITRANPLPKQRFARQ